MRRTAIAPRRLDAHTEAQVQQLMATRAEQLRTASDLAPAICAAARAGDTESAILAITIGRNHSRRRR